MVVDDTLGWTCIRSPLRLQLRSPDLGGMSYHALQAMPFSIPWCKGRVNWIVAP
jgi:hypothetical protein